MNFANRHIGISASDSDIMLNDIQSKSIESLVSETIPGKIHSPEALNTGLALSEQEYLSLIKRIGAKNKFSKLISGWDITIPLRHPSFCEIYLKIRMVHTIHPLSSGNISRQVESLLNYQTMIMDMTGLPIANASLLDEATAGAEVLTMFHSARNKTEISSNKFFLDQSLFPQTIAVIKTKAELLGIEIIEGNIHKQEFNQDFCGVLVQNPSINGDIIDYSSLFSELKSKNIYTRIVADIFSLVLVKTPGEMGADCAVGSTQRFGVPIGYGGPYAAYFATTDEFKRLIPGRIIGVSKDRRGKNALRMALQTREQHIRREKATSNICTAQALLANMAAMYAIYHGPENLKNIASEIHSMAIWVKSAIQALGFQMTNSNDIFDTITIQAENTDKLKTIAEAHRINFYYEKNLVRISINENTNHDDIKNIISVWEEFSGKKSNTTYQSAKISQAFERKTDFLTHPIFNSLHSETKMMRYIKTLENKDLSLTQSMIPLGSYTMKLNAATELMPLSWDSFSSIHPFVPKDQAEGYQMIISELEQYLANITGFAGTSLQPNSGAQGEYAGLMVIRDYQKSMGQGHRNICIIPSSAHGTNLASAVLAGLKVVVSPADENGNINLIDLQAKAEEHRDNLCCLMVTYPSTHGIFEEGIMDVCKIIHDNGGQVYMDGANMNAQVGITSPGYIGADVCHLNLHKTFAIPHGGGGPGVGPICVAKHLTPFLPTHPIIKTGGEKATQTISAAPYGSASICLISYAYIKMLGSKGLREATEYAILNANYIKSKLEAHYKILYTGENGRVAHELIVDFRPFKHSLGIEVEDVAKRLMDYGIHAPTVSFPVAGTLMIEPTESEDKKELDRLIHALISIRKEIEEIEKEVYPKDNNVLKNAPHTAEEALCDDWKFPYSREKALYPLESVKENKFWISVSRVDNSYGDRNLVCSCLPMEEYM